MISKMENNMKDIQRSTDYAIADILSSMSNNEPLNLQFSSAPNLSNNVSSITTPALTPNTLTSIQSFLGLDIPTPVDNEHNRTSGFVPPLIAPITSTNILNNNEYYSSNDSSEDNSYEPVSSKIAKRDDFNSVLVIKPQGEIPRNVSNLSPQRSNGLSNIDVTDDEQARRKLRRERNKVAAAKCRQRRVDLTKDLEQQKDQMEDDCIKLVKEVENLRAFKRNIHQIINDHKCSTHSNIIKENIQLSYPDHKSNYSVKEEPIDSSREESNPGVSVVNFSNVQIPVFYGQRMDTQTRPNSLPISSISVQPKISAMKQSTLTEETGISISTPSNGLFGMIGMESLADGLTPIIGKPSGMTPSGLVSFSGSTPQTLTTPQYFGALSSVMASFNSDSNNPSDLSTPTVTSSC